MRIYRLWVLAVATAAALSVAAQSPGEAAGRATVESVNDVYFKGLQSYKNGAYKAAVRDLKRASAGGILLADFYLARIYENERSGQANRLEAFLHYKSVADALFDIDPDNDPRIRFAGQALTALARYVRDGIPELGIAPDVARAAKFFRHAAVFFREEDAKFELAKMQLDQARRTRRLSRNDRDVRLAVNDLSELSRKGHVGAQAYLARLLWDGKLVREDRVLAYSLASVAVSGLTDTRSDDARVSWVLRVHRTIHCSAPSGLRERARSTLEWLKRNYVRRHEQAEGDKRAPTVDALGADGKGLCDERNGGLVYRAASGRADRDSKGGAKVGVQSGQDFMLSGASSLGKAKEDFSRPRPLGKAGD